jgi:hypothetical protein
MPLTWTTQKPTKPGWYWWRSYRGYDPIAVQILGFDSADSFSLVYGLNRPLGQCDGDWAGPIPVPVEESGGLEPLCYFVRRRGVGRSEQRTLLASDEDAATVRRLYLPMLRSLRAPPGVASGTNTRGENR